VVIVVVMLRALEPLLVHVRVGVGDLAVAVLVLVLDVIVLVIGVGVAVARPVVLVLVTVRLVVLVLVAVHVRPPRRSLPLSMPGLQRLATRKADVRGQVRPTYQSPNTTPNRPSAGISAAR
jgi:hypothetical protein